MMRKWIEKMSGQKRYRIVVWMLVVMMLCGCSVSAVLANGGKTGNISETELDLTEEEAALAKRENWSELWIEAAGYESVGGIELEDGLGLYAAYPINEKRLPSELVKEVLLAEREISIKQKDGEDETYYCKDGTWLRNNMGALFFSTEEGLYWPSPTCFYDKEFRDLIFPGETSEVLFHDTIVSFDYGDTETAMKLTAKYLDQLGITYGSQWQFCSISGSDMEAAMKLAYPDSEYSEELVSGLEKFEQPKWSKVYASDDDVFIFRIPMAIAGHVLTDSERLILQSPELPWDRGCLIYAMVGREGLRRLEIHHLYETGQQTDKMTAVPSDDILERVKTSMEEHIYRVSDIEQILDTSVTFCYYPDMIFDGSNTGNLVPCWEVRILFEHKEYGRILYIDNINALDGKSMESIGGMVDEKGLMK